MAEPQHDPTLLSWALGALATAVSAAFGWVWQRLARTEDRMSAEDAKLRAEMAEGRDKLWTAVQTDRDRAQAFRERTLERLGEMPTKSDLAEMERRLAARLDDRHPHT